MQATHEEIEVLYEVQNRDLEAKKLKQLLDNLPQRSTILEARKKREAIMQKSKQIDALHKEAVKKLNRINDEDASLEKKENGVQAAIEAAGNDYRNAEARTKELNGIFRRRGELSESRDKVSEELNKINGLKSQIGSALDDLDVTENEAIDSFKTEGGDLNNRIAKAQAEREALLKQLSSEVAAFFDKTSANFDTVSIAKLEGSTCSVCRSKIEQGHLIALRKDAPLTTCPSCKRILIIE